VEKRTLRGRIALEKNCSWEELLGKIVWEKIDQGKLKVIRKIVLKQIEFVLKI
jgi:hypothetical protein